MASEYDSRSERTDEKENDPRVRATSRIWGMMIPILALSIPICAISHLGVILPFIAVIAAGLGTGCVWIVGGKGGSKENKRLHDRIKELEERLANVETISHFESLPQERRGRWRIRKLSRNLNHLNLSQAKKRAPEVPASPEAGARRP